MNRRSAWGTMSIFSSIVKLKFHAAMVEGFPRGEGLGFSVDLDRVVGIIEIERNSECVGDL